MNKYIIFIVLVVVVLAGLYFYYAGTPKGQDILPVVSVPASPEISGSEVMPVQNVSAVKNYIVEIIDNEFKPSVVKIKKGDFVTWINKMAIASWPASAAHPTHIVYPETGGCIGSAFDVCRGLKTGESWTFTFNQVGTWKYHDHINFGVVKPGSVEVAE
ncbi:MAG: hypothetical protein AAB772_01115 [Patescibacteria group bacterium]